jgi:dihydroflavonol-4-reductase
MARSEAGRKALVLGASGHIGNAIVRELLDRGWTVTAASRQAAPAPNLVGLPIGFVSGIPEDVDGFARHFAGQVLVVDAATPYPTALFDLSGDRSTPMERAAKRTRTLLRAARRTGSVLACVSAFTTLLDPATVPVEGLRHPYFGVKRAIEREVLDACEEDQPCLLVNPTLCLGPWDCKRPELTLLPYLVAPDTRFVAEHSVNVIDVREVAALLVEAFDAGLFGRRLLCAGHDITMSELSRRARALWGRRTDPSPRPVPAGGLAAAAALGELLVAGLGRPSPFPSVGLALLLRHRGLGPGPEQCRLGVLPRDLDESLAAGLAWYAGLGYC